MAPNHKRALKPASHDELIARVTIHRAADMSARGRRQIANWLLRQGKALLKEGPNYAKRFTAKYYWVD